MTSRQNRNGEMRLEILKSAAAAFRRRGYYGASVDEIASALHMTKGNLYYYFKDKEDILFACHEFALDLLLRMLKKVEDSSHPPQEKLRRVIVSFVHINDGRTGALRFPAAKSHCKARSLRPRDSPYHHSRN
jgi:AcrR family transcriptional regulator